MASLTLGGWVRTRRTSLGMSLRDVEARSGIRYNFLSRVERGQRFLATSHFAGLAKALRCSVRDLRLADEFTPCRHCGRTGPRR